MTEAEWLVCDNPAAKMIVARSAISRRKRHLIAAAFVRRLQTLPRLSALKRCDDIIEAVADDPRARRGHFDVLFERPDQWGFNGVLKSDSVIPPDENEVDVAVRQLLSHFSADVPGYAVELIHEIVGNPFRPIAFDHTWRTDTAVALARLLYESRDFSAMPILADAFQDAGCDNDDILSHCRGPGPHVRGCWVVDLVLGKE
jgi:hypothetical protein